MAAKSYDEWKPTNEQALKISEAADVFGLMVWDAASNKLKAEISVCENRILEYVKFVSGKDDELLDIANELRKLTAVDINKLKQ